MSFSLHQLKYLVAVADTDSITAASRELGISQSAIKGLEREMVTLALPFTQNFFLKLRLG